MDISHDQYLAWPPFYTLQPNLDTQRTQLKLWAEIISKHCKENKQFLLDLSQLQHLFRNDQINRALDQEFQAKLLQNMIINKRVIKIDSQFYALWRSLQDWANLLYTWANDNGQIDEVETLEELTNGTLTIGQEFHGLPYPLMLEISKLLEKSGKAELFTVRESYVIKFLN